jgi:hypothetical protein
MFRTSKCLHNFNLARVPFLIPSHSSRYPSPLYPAYIIEPIPRLGILTPKTRGCMFLENIGVLLQDKRRHDLEHIRMTTEANGMTVP